MSVSIADRHHVIAQLLPRAPNASFTGGAEQREVPAAGS
jgi:hypothetical protein